MGNYNECFSIDKKEHPNIEYILDKWKKRSDNKSAKICLAIELLDAQEESGSKMDEYLDIGQKELMKFPRINQLLKWDDIKLLYDTLGWTEFDRLSRIMETNTKTVLDAVNKPKRSLA